jgi:hypothetical protein
MDQGMEGDSLDDRDTPRYQNWASEEEKDQLLRFWIRRMFGSEAS